MQASESWTNYTANWWTQGNDPATNNGGPGSGQPWTSNGACAGGSGGSPSPTPTPTPTSTGTGSAGSLLFSPYNDVTINMNWNTDQMQSAVEGSAIPVVGSGSLVSTYVPKLWDLGISVPDPDLAWDEAAGEWRWSQPNWDTFWEVVKGNGPMTSVRLAARKSVWDTHAWIREAFAGIPTAA